MFADLLTAAITGEPFAGRLQLRSPGGPVAGGDGSRPGARSGGPTTTPSGSTLEARRGRAGRTRRPVPPVGRPERRMLLRARRRGRLRARLVWADARVVELTGYELDELQAMGGFFSLVASADLPGLHRRNQRLLTNQPGPIRYRVRRKSGELRWLLDTARAERAGEADVVRRVVGTLAGVGEGGIDGAGAAGAGAAGGAARGYPGRLPARARRPWAPGLGERPSGRAHGRPVARSCRSEPELGAAAAASGFLAGLAGRGGSGAPAAALPFGLG